MSEEPADLPYLRRPFGIASHDPDHRNERLILGGGATCRTHRKLRTAAGVVAELHVYEGMSHADYLTAATAMAPEGRDALGEVAAFFDRHWKR